MSSRRVTQTATVAIMLVLGGSLFAPVATMAEEIPWAKTYNGSGHDIAYDLVQTSDGGYALVGPTHSIPDTLEIDPIVNYNYLLVKTDANGVVQWNQTYGGKDYDTPDALIQTPDGGYALAGETYSYGAGSIDYWLVKTDSNGIIQWNRTYGGAGTEEASGIIQTSDDGFALIGHTRSYGAGGDYVSAAWLIKTDADGVMQWNRTYGPSDFERGYTLIQTADGGFVFGGTQVTPSPFFIKATNQASSSQDFWLVKTDATGVAQWNQTYGTEDKECVYDLIQTTDGGFMLAGEKRSYSTGQVLWLVKTDVTGVVQWNQTYGPPLGRFTNIIQTPDAGYIFARTRRSSETQQLEEQFEGWLTKIASNGNIQWERRYNQAYITSLILTSDEGFAMAGMVMNQGTGADFLLIRTTDTGVLPSAFQTPETFFLLYALWL
ncbi:MAG: hypothetical protein ACFFC7_31455, partial [Candidatus Hermodarchaeota archaeon]